MLGMSAVLAACGVKGATSSGGPKPAGGVGTAAWWAKQKSTKTVNFANWPYYIDVVKGKHLSLERFTATTGIAVNYTEPIGNNMPFYGKIRTSLSAKKLNQQRSDGIVRAYYDQSYIDHLKNGDTVVTQAWSGDIFQADLNSKYRDLALLIPNEGGMFWTDNMCIPMYAQNPRDAMTLMDFYYQPDVEAVVEYYDDYICPVPAAKQALLSPTGWASKALKELAPEIGLPTSQTADAPTVFPTPAYVKNSRPYYLYKNPEELTPG